MDTENYTLIVFKYVCVCVCVYVCVTFKFDICLPFVLIIHAV